MAGILKSSGITKREVGYVHILVVGSNYFCDKLNNALHNYSRKKDLKVKVHISNHIEDILSSDLQPEVDFIIFEMNTQYKNCLEELENNIKLLEDFLKFGHMCFVNNSAIKPGEMAVSHNDISNIANKYGVNLLNGNVESERKCLYLAERVLNLACMTIGVNTGVPYIHCLLLGKPME